MSTIDLTNNDQDLRKQTSLEQSDDTTNAANASMLFNCKSCDGPDGIDDMVQCDKCNNWHHFQCVGVTADIKSQVWICANCQVEASARPSVNQLNESFTPQEHQEQARSTNKTHKSRSGSNTSSRAAQALQELEEEKRAIEAIDEEERLIIERDAHRLAQKKKGFLPISSRDVN